MADQTIGTARIEIEIDNSKVEPGINRAKQSVSSLTTEVEQGSQRQVQATTRQIKALERQIATLGKDREEIIRWRIAQQTSGAEAARLTALLDRQAASMAKAATSSGQYRAALRSLPAQGTDIVTQLAGGQNFGLVLLQQGGQIRDQFGSASLAIRGVGTALAGLINPVTLTAGAIAAVALAWKSARDEQVGFQNALILTGNYAGKSVTQLQAITAQLDAIGGISRGDAADAVRSVAESGRFAGQQFDQVAAAAARMQSSTGQAIDTTVDKFKEIEKDPVTALLKLNDAEHFLTRSQIDRIRTLQEEGQEQQAASEAITVYADHLTDVSTKADAAMPAMARMWRDIKDEISGAWSEAQSYGALLDRIAARHGVTAADPSLSNITAPARNSTLLGFLPDGAGTLVNALLKQQLGQLAGSDGTSSRHTPGRSAADAIIDSGDVERQMKLEDQWAQVTQQNLTKQQRKLEEINKVKKLGADLGLSQVEIEKQIDAIEARYADHAKKKKEKLTEEEKAAKKLQETYESITDQLERQAALAGDRTNFSRVQYEIANGNLRGLDTSKQADLLNLAQVTDAVNDYAAIYGDGYDNIVFKTKESSSEISEYAKQAARNSQTAFADFLFDPFDDGLDGMVKGFSETVRRLAAEVASAKLFEGFGNWAKGYSGNGAGIINAIGGALSQDVTRNAMGGVYDSPSLSRYSNSIVHQPTTFAFAKGAGLMGEAGPEAIIPLSRGANGRLGISAQGVSQPQQVSITINENADRTGAEATSTASGLNIDIWLEGKVKGMFAGGRMDAAMGQRFNLRPQGARYG